MIVFIFNLYRHVDRFTSLYFRLLKQFSPQKIPPNIVQTSASAPRQCPRFQNALEHTFLLNFVIFQPRRNGCKYQQGFAIVHEYAFLLPIRISPALSFVQPAPIDRRSRDGNLKAITRSPDLESQLDQNARARHRSELPADGPQFENCHNHSDRHSIVDQVVSGGYLRLLQEEYQDGREDGDHYGRQQRNWEGNDPGTGETRR